MIKDLLSRCCGKKVIVIFCSFSDKADYLCPHCKSNCKINFDDYSFNQYKQMCIEYGELVSHDNNENEETLGAIKAATATDKLRKCYVNAIDPVHAFKILRSELMNK